MPHFEMTDRFPKPPAHEPFDIHKLYRQAGVDPDPAPPLAEEVAKLREAVEELAYWLRPQMGQIVTGKASVEEFERLTGRKP